MLAFNKTQILQKSRCHDEKTLVIGFVPWKTEQTHSTFLKCSLTSITKIFSFSQCLQQILHFLFCQEARGFCLVSEITNMVEKSEKSKAKQV